MWPFAWTVNSRIDLRVDRQELTRDVRTETHIVEVDVGRPTEPTNAWMRLVTHRRVLGPTRRSYRRRLPIIERTRSDKGFDHVAESAKRSFLSRFGIRRVAAANRFLHRGDLRQLVWPASRADTLRRGRVGYGLRGRRHRGRASYGLCRRRRIRSGPRRWRRLRSALLRLLLLGALFAFRDCIPTCLSSVSRLRLRLLRRLRVHVDLYESTSSR
jgi:hypothetical protein